MRPQDVALRAQRFDRQFLLRSRTSVLRDPGQRELSVFRALREARLEVRQTRFYIIVP